MRDIIVQVQILVLKFDIYVLGINNSDNFTMFVTNNELFFIQNPEKHYCTDITPHYYNIIIIAYTSLRIHTRQFETI